MIRFMKRFRGAEFSSAELRHKSHPLHIGLREQGSVVSLCVSSQDPMQRNALVLDELYVQYEIDSSPQRARGMP